MEKYSKANGVFQAFFAALALSHHPEFHLLRHRFIVSIGKSLLLRPEIIQVMETFAGVS